MGRTAGSRSARSQLEVDIFIATFGDRRGQPGGADTSVSVRDRRIQGNRRVGIGSAGVLSIIVDHLPAFA